MISISGDQAILKSKDFFDSGNNGFLAVIEVAKASDFLLFVQIIARDLHSAHNIHVSIKF